MSTTTNIRNNNNTRVSEEKQDQKKSHAQIQQLLPQGLLPLDDEQINKLLALVAVENHKILRLSLLENL
ncbi:hypothetical protein [Dictyobacter formicarum]|uniref:Uncharacterized protein n=1 Tax=Dictyobacter formicarum TaxID=2778368 RepID=A0ABQ3VSW8_9CHLR|nr:hypothetical protein [Dictyobacter formicarum]GHO89305.1 hypothetical protein KSZ_73110 [Dictyobacter formicarum]